MSHSVQCLCCVLLFGWSAAVAFRLTKLQYNTIKHLYGTQWSTVESNMRPYSRASFAVRISMQCVLLFLVYIGL